MMLIASAIKLGCYTDDMDDMPVSSVFQ
jgi:hypothetical protein